MSRVGFLVEWDINSFAILGNVGAINVSNHKCYIPPYYGDGILVLEMLRRLLLKLPNFDSPFALFSPDGKYIYWTESPNETLLTILLAGDIEEYIEKYKKFLDRYAREVEKLLTRFSMTNSKIPFPKVDKELRKLHALNNFMRFMSDRITQMTRFPDEYV